MQRVPQTQIWFVVQLAPIVAVLGLLFGGALILALLQSLGYAPWFGINQFPDTQYYQQLWMDVHFWQATALTFYYALAATVMTLFLGIVLALIFIKSFRGKRAFQTLYKLPLVLPYMVGVALAILMLGNGGMISRLIAAFGLIDDPSQFPQLLETHYGWGIIALYVWKQMPFVTLVIYSVLLGVNPETRESATLLGANRWQIFLNVTLPQIMPGIVTSSLIVFAFNMGAFEAPFILGGGFPDTLPVLAWRYFNDADYHLQLKAMAVIMSLVLLSGVFLGICLTFYRKFERLIGRR